MAGKEGEGCDLARQRDPCSIMKEVLAGQREQARMMEQMLGALLKRACGAVGQAEVSSSDGAVSKTGSAAPTTTPPSDQGTGSEDPPSQLERGALEALEVTRGEVTRQGVALEAGRMSASKKGTPAHLRDLPGGGEGGLGEQRRWCCALEEGSSGACGKVEGEDGAPSPGQEEPLDVVGVPDPREDPDVVEQRRGQGATEEGATPVAAQEEPHYVVGVPGLDGKRAPRLRRVARKAGRGYAISRAGWKKDLTHTGVPTRLRGRRRFKRRRRAPESAPRRTVRKERGGRRRPRRNHKGFRGPLCRLAPRISEEVRGRRLAPQSGGWCRPPPWPPPAPLCEE